MMRLQASCLAGNVILLATLLCFDLGNAHQGWQDVLLARGKRQALGGAVTTLVSSNTNQCSAVTYLSNNRQVAQCPAGSYGAAAFGPCQPCMNLCATCQAASSCTSCDGKSNSILQNGECVDKCQRNALLVQRAQRNANLIRLVSGGDSVQRGRLEVRDGNGNWGTVCNQSFTMQSANVVCRQLGFGTAAALTNGQYPVSNRNSPINLGMVRCSGNEDSIFQCPLQRRQDVVCSHFEDVEIQCTGPDQQATCETACPVGFYVGYDIASGASVCLPCDPACVSCKSTPKQCTACPYGQSLNGTVCVATCGEGLYGNTGTGLCQACSVGCRQCANGLVNNLCTACPDGQFLSGTICTAQCQDLSIRPTTRLLTNKVGDLTGILEVYYAGKWGSVCRDGFGSKEANVACTSLRLGRAAGSISVRGTVSRYPVSTVINLDDVKCNGSETDIRTCNHAAFTIHNCNHQEDIVLTCTGPYVSPSDLVKCVQTCPTGTYTHQVDRLCLPCSTACLDCRGLPQVCTSCRRGRYFIGSQCVTKCPDHMYANSQTNTCTECAANCLTCADGTVNSTCTRCAPGLQLSGTFCVSACPPPLYSSAGQCVPTCPVGTIGNSMNEGGSCVDCPRNCTKCTLDASSGRILCTQCSKTLVEEGGQCKMACSGGKRPEPVIVNSVGVRLAGGNASSGRLEIFYGNRWGSICDDYWSATNARVVCEELGFSDVLVSRYPTSNSFVKAHKDDPIWMDNVRCTGLETSLYNCSHQGWGRTDCSHTEDVAISCNGSIADRCVEQCSPGLTRIDNSCERCSGGCLTCQGTTTRCIGCRKGTFLQSDTCVTQCDKRFYKDIATNKCLPCTTQCESCAGVSSNCTSCASDQYLVGNRCQADCSPQLSLQVKPSVRLQGGRTGSLEGRVEIFHEGKWGLVCDDYWSLQDGEVLCRQLHFGSVIAVFFRSYFGSNSSQSIVLDDVRCTGNESRLEDCRSRKIGSHNCYQTEIAGVQCSGPDSSRRCVESCPTGYISMADNSCKACDKMCLTCGNSPDRCSACYTGFLLQGSTCVEQCSSNYYREGLTCKPCSANCAKCNGPAVNNCTDCARGLYLMSGKCVSSCESPHYTLYTPPPEGIRLANSTDQFAGRVEVYNTFTQQWGTVCDDSWSWPDAVVVCRQLGFGPPLNTINQHNRSFAGREYFTTITNRSYPVMLDDLRCRGSEPTLFDCNHAGVAIHNCAHREDAGVVCSPPPVLAPFCLASCSATSSYRVVNETLGTCEKCDPTCSQCSQSSASVCERCISGRFLSSTEQGKCVLNCPTNYYGNTLTGMCQPCHTKCRGCFTGPTNDICIRCNITQNARYVLDGTKCTTTCPSADGVLRHPLRDTFVGNSTNIKLNNGIVQIFGGGKFGPICSSGRAWDRFAATVVCRQLNQGLPVRWTTSSVTLNQDAVSYLYCTGTEASIFDCQMRRSVVGTCYQASVTCNASLEAYDEEVCTTVNRADCGEGLCEAAAGCFTTNKIIGYKSACWECPRSFVGDGRNCATYSLVPHHLVLTPRNQSAIVNQTSAVVMSCGANASTIINWYHENSTGTVRLNLLPTSLTTLDYFRPRVHYKLSATGSLLLGRVQLFMAGTYRCVSSTTKLSVALEAVLSVISPSPVHVQPFNFTTEIPEKAPFVIRCRTSGYPAPSVEWRRGTVPIVQDGVKYGLTNDSLIFFNPTLADSAQYFCYARNNYSSDSASTNLRVKGAPIFSILPPLVSAPIIENGDIVLTCGLTAFTGTTIYWLYPRSVVKPESRVVIAENADGPSSTLTIRGALHSDSGLYTCTAMNSVGIADHQSSVVVSGTLVQAGGTVRLECADYFESDDRRVLWSVLKDAVRASVVFDERVVHNGSHLTITNAMVSDSGRYECVIANVQDETLSSRDTTVLVLGKPVLTSSSTTYTVGNNNQGKTVLLNLDIDSNLRYSVTWRKNGQAITPDAHTAQLSNGSLMICNVQPSDFGAYEVQVSSTAGTSVLNDRIISEQNNPTSSSSSNTTAIAVGVVCSILAIALIAVVVVVVYRRSRDHTIFQVKEGDRKKVGKGTRDSTKSTAALYSDAPDSMAIGNRMAGDDGNTGFAKVGASLPTQPPQPAPQLDLAPGEDVARFTKNGVQSTLYTSV